MTGVRAAWAVIGLFAASQAGAGEVEVTVTATGGQPLAEAAAILEPVAPIAAAKPATVTIEQRDREIIPYVTIVQAGAAIDFPNHDPFKHHLYSFSPAKVFEIRLYVGTPAQPVVFDKPGEVALGCNIHDWMEGYVLVVDTPFFAKTDARGRARVASVPPGAYRLRLWHPHQKRELPARAIEVGADTVRMRVALDVAPRMSRPKPPLDKESY